MKRAYQSKPILVYVGTYTQTGAGAVERAEGIHVFRLDPDSGNMEQIQAVTGIPNPSYLALSQDHRFLYAANELEEYSGQPGGAISAFSVDPLSGRLEFINQQPTLGGLSCYVSLDTKHHYAWVANYSSGNATILPIMADGSLAAPEIAFQNDGHGMDPQRQETSHVHSVVSDPGNVYMLAADLGLDKICVYRMEDIYRKSTRQPVYEAFARPGAGPRHLVFHPNQPFVYAVNELDSSVSFFRFDQKTGSLDQVENLSTLPDDFHGINYSADVHVTPNGKFLYMSNRGFDCISRFSIEPLTGCLTLLGYTPTLGNTPRNFAITPDGGLLLVANQDSDSIYVFQVDSMTGDLKQHGNVGHVPSPACIQVVVL